MYCMLDGHVSMIRSCVDNVGRETMERENELRYSIDPSGNGINRRTSMSVTDMSNLAAINNQQQQQQHLLQQRLCSVCCRRDVSLLFFFKLF